MASISDLFPTHDLLDFSQQLVPAAMLGETLFPRVKVQSNDIKILLPNSALPTIAKVHGFDTETEIGKRSAAVANVSPFYIKKNMIINEDEMVKLNASRMNPTEHSFLIRQVYSDFSTTVSSVLSAIEQMRMQALTTGKINVKGEDGNTYKVDYRLSSSQKHTFDWSDADHNIFADLTALVAGATVTPTRALMTQRTLSAILANTTIKSQIFGAASSLQVISLPQLNQFFVTNGLPMVAVYNGKYLDDDNVPHTYINDGDIAFFIDGLIGNTVFGLTPEESFNIVHNDVEISENNFIFSHAYSHQDPYQEIIGAAAMAIPALAQKQYLQLASVTLPALPTA